MKKITARGENLQWQHKRRIMKIIKRDHYLNKLIEKRGNGLVKVITGIRRCGKSILLDPIFSNYLKQNGVKSSHIIKIALDETKYIKFHKDPGKLFDYIQSKVKDADTYYILLDEIQLVQDFESLLNALIHIKNVDVYVTGSNSKFLSTDIITEFRGRSDQIRLLPLSFDEFYSTYSGSFEDAIEEYKTFGGMPLTLSQKTNNDKSNYLKNLFEETYYRDIIERYSIQRLDVLDSVTNILASSVASLTNPQKILDTFKSAGNEISINTINKYISALEDSFVVKKAYRYDVKGRNYISTPLKFYFTDIGLRNACLNYRQMEDNHLYENLVFNELIKRDYNVDVGVVPITENREKKTVEVDFVCNQSHKRYYIQVALGLDDDGKLNQELRSLVNINDSFKKIIVVAKNIIP